MLFPVEHHVKFCADPADIIEQHRIEPKRSRGGDIHGAVVKEDTLARIQAVAVQENPENLRVRLRHLLLTGDHDAVEILELKNPKRP